MKRKGMIDENAVSLSSVVAERAGDEEEIELISDVEVVEELSDEAKKMRERALLATREKALAIIDQKKIPLAMKEIDSIELYSDILQDPEVLERIKENIKSPMDLKFFAEAQKIKLQNLQTLLRMDSVNTEGNAGEIFVGIEFGGSGGGRTKVVVGQK